MFSMTGRNILNLMCISFQEKVVAGIIEASYVPTLEQIAVFFTKALVFPQFNYLLGKMSVLNIHSPDTHLEGKYW